MNAAQKRLRVRDAYRQLLGRNRYSQTLRDYCFRPYADGSYYSDCSSSVCYSYRQAGCDFGILNTVGMLNSGKLRRVDVPIQDGVPQDVTRLRIGDMLLFAGGDASRAPWDYVGHVEMVGEIEDNRAILYGHGSGTPSKKEMEAYCRKRRRQRADTPRGNRGLIRILRYLSDDASDDDVLRVQRALLCLGYALPRFGADGEYGSETAAAIRAFQRDRDLKVSGFIDDALRRALGLGRLRVKGDSVYVRAEPRVCAGNILGLAHRGEVFLTRGEAENGFHPIEYEAKEAWISTKWTEMEGRE